MPQLPAIERTIEFQDYTREKHFKKANAAYEKALVSLPPIEAPAGYKKLEVEVYACPTVGCDDYFGHRRMPYLEHTALGHRDLNFGPKSEDQHRTRATCPVCFTDRGERVERIRCSSFVFVPVAGA